MVNWYAVQLTSDALNPAIKRYVEEGPQRGRYLKRQKLDETVIARTCDQLQIDIYVPRETIFFIHRRTKKRMEKEIQLLPGYGFIHGLPDISSLERVAGIVGIMTNGIGKPPTIVPARDIEALQRAEGIITQEYLDRKRQYEWESKTLTKKELAQLYPTGRKIVVKGEHQLTGQPGTIKSHTGRKEIQAMIEFLSGLVSTTLRIDQIDLIE